MYLQSFLNRDSFLNRAFLNRDSTVMKNNEPKLALAKYLTNVKFGSCDFFLGPKVALGKDLLYRLFSQLVSSKGQLQCQWVQKAVVSRHCCRPWNLRFWIWLLNVPKVCFRTYRARMSIVYFEVHLRNDSAPTPWLTQILITQMSLIWLFKKFPFLT